MDPKHDATIETLATLSMTNCLLRLARVSAGTWRAAGTTVTSGTLSDALRTHTFTNPAAAVHFNLKGTPPVTGIMLFDVADLECVSRCFTGHSFPRSGAVTASEEIMLTELGNIVLNAQINSLLNALKKSFMPAMPMLAEGDLARVSGEISKTVNPGQAYRIVASALELESDNCLAKVQVLVMLPEELALELERLPPGSGA